MDLPAGDDVRCPDLIEFDVGSAPSIDSLARFEREQQIAFARSHRDLAERSAHYLEALAGRVAIAASCLAIGCPSALIPHESWSVGGHAWVFGDKDEGVLHEGARLREAQVRWGDWYRFFTRGSHDLQACARRMERPKLVATRSFIRKWRRLNGQISLSDPRELTEVLLGIALEAEAYANNTSPLFIDAEGAQPVLSVGSFVRSANPADPLCGKARFGAEFLPSLMRLRRWDPTGRRSRAAAMKHFVTLP